jgi:hypothetical protein
MRGVRKAFVTIVLIFVILLSSLKQVQASATSDVTRRISFLTAYGTRVYSELFTILADRLDYWRSMPHSAAVLYDSKISMNFSQFIDTSSVQGISKRIASVARLGEEDVADTILSFVQNLGYVQNDYTSGYTLYPLDTMAQGGVCDDLSIVYASMMMSLGFKVIFIRYPKVTDLGGSKITHLNVGVHLSSSPKHGTDRYSYLTLDELDYYIAETTSAEWQVGDLPPSLTGQSYYLEKASEPTRSFYQTGVLAPSLGTSSHISPTNVVVGGTITAYFYITNPNSYSIQVGLGMSIRKVGTDSEILDSPNDIVVTVSPGTKVYSRTFLIPGDALPGNYEWLIGIWPGTPGRSHEYVITGWRNGLTVNPY